MPKVDRTPARLPKSYSRRPKTHSPANVSMNMPMNESTSFLLEPLKENVSIVAPDALLQSFMGKISTVNSNAESMLENRLVSMPSFDDLVSMIEQPDQSVVESEHSLLIPQEQQDSAQAIQVITTSASPPLMTIGRKSIPPGKTKMTSVELGRVNLGNDRFVVVCNFGGEIKVHIREYTPRGYPLPLGICLTPTRWASLVRVMNSLGETVSTFDTHEYMKADARFHLGGGIYVSIDHNYPCVDIRKYFMPEGATTEVATRRGIALRFAEWHKLRASVDQVNQLSEELANAIPCTDRLDHSNLEGFVMCMECNPHGDFII